MRISPRNAVRRLLPASAILAALGVWAALAWGAPVVTIVTPDANRVQVDLGAREPDRDSPYRLRSTKGDEAESRNFAVYPLNEILAEHGVDGGVQEVILGEAVKIDEVQLNEVPPPGFYLDDAGVVRFIRSSFAPNDLNHTSVERDLVVSEITLSSESSLDLLASAERAAPGDPVTFQVRTSGGGRGQQYEFRWRFGDGGSATGAEVEHEYEGKGPFTAKVTALSPGSEDRLVAQLTEPVQVRFKKPKDKEPAEEEDQTDESTGTGAGAGSGTGKGSAGTTTYDGSAGAMDSGAPTADAFDSIVTDRESGVGDTVEGALLADVDAPLGGSGGSDSAVATRPLDFEVPEPDGEIPPAAWSGLGALALMGAGALLESDRRPRLRRLRLRLTLPRR